MPPPDGSAPCAAAAGCCSSRAPQEKGRGVNWSQAGIPGHRPGYPVTCTWSRGRISDPLTRTRNVGDLATRARCDPSAPPGRVAVKVSNFGLMARLILLNEMLMLVGSGVSLFTQIRQLGNCFMFICQLPLFPAMQTSIPTRGINAAHAQHSNS